MQHRSTDSTIPVTSCQKCFIAAAHSENTRACILKAEENTTTLIKQEIKRLRELRLLTETHDPKKPFIGKYVVFFPNPKTETIEINVERSCGLTVYDEAKNLRQTTINGAVLLRKISKNQEITALFANNSPAPKAHRHEHHTLTNAWFRPGTYWSQEGLPGSNIDYHNCHSQEGDFLYFEPLFYHSSPLPSDYTPQDSPGLILALRAD